MRVNLQRALGLWGSNYNEVGLVDARVSQLGKTLFLLLVDDKSHFMWLILLHSKGEAAEVIKRIQARAGKRCKCCVCRVAPHAHEKPNQLLPNQGYIL